MALLDAFTNGFRRTIDRLAYEGVRSAADEAEFTFEPSMDVYSPKQNTFDVRATATVPKGSHVAKRMDKISKMVVDEMSHSPHDSSALAIINNETHKAMDDDELPRYKTGYSTLGSPLDKGGIQVFDIVTGPLSEQELRVFTKWDPSMSAESLASFYITNLSITPGAAPRKRAPSTAVSAAASKRPKPKTKSKAAAKPKPKTKSKAAAKPKPKTKSKAATKAKPKTKSTSKPKSKSKVCRGGDPKRRYKGTEPSPKGRGFCAYAYSDGKRMLGKDKKMWVVRENVKGVRQWRRVPTRK